VTLKCY